MGDRRFSQLHRLHFFEPDVLGEPPAGQFKIGKSLRTC